MLKYLSTLFIIVALTTAAYAGSKVRLDKPDQTSVGTSTYEVSSVKFRWDASPTITDNEAYVNIDLRGEGGIRMVDILTGDDAVAFLADLDAANVPIKNLRKWVLQWLV
ncbi:hypothetical protein LCGC14_2659370, partial [marine sediment metagenome]